MKGSNRGHGDHRSSESEEDEYQLAPSQERDQPGGLVDDYLENERASEALAKRRKPLTWEPEPANPWKVPALIALAALLAGSGLAVYLVWFK